jgi:dTDP-4-amino-4,6-dideoxygalactose transaminase
MQQVPFLDLKAGNQAIWSEVQPAIDKVMQDGAFVLGPAVERFEKSFADYLGVGHCVGLNNGTSALHLALLACGVGPGDEVITTPHSWISTTWAISYVGAKPVFVDIDPKTFNLDPARVAAAITPRTKAILPVHLYGQAADLDKLLAVAKAHNVTLIEDAAQAHGAKYNGARVGSLGKVGCFSFYPGKNLGAFGEGGAVVTSDASVADRIRRLRDHAQQGRHVHTEVGFNMRMEGIQGAVLDVKLRHLDAWNAARVSHAKRYAELLAGIPGLELPAPGAPDSHVFHLYVVLVRGRDREQVRAALGERGIQTGVHYPTPIPFQPVYAHLGYTPKDFPVATDVTASCISLPMFPQLTEEQIERTATALREVLASK